jgi:MFS family permease
VLGYDALQTGFVILALAIGSFVASGFAGAFGNRVSPVWIVRFGLIAEIIGVLAVGAVISTDAQWWAIVIGLFIYGFGVGLATAQLTSVVLRDVPVEQSGQGSGTQSTSRQIGSALGIAILGTILFTSVGSVLDARLADRGVPAAAAEQIVAAVVDSSGTAIPGLEKSDADTAADARIAFSDGTKFAAFAAAGFLTLGLLATLRLDGRREEHPDESPVESAPAAS